jgi:hypothetical protein
MKNYVGRKIRGFRFESEMDDLLFNREMRKNIGEIGEIIVQHESSVKIQFEKESWYYPISLVDEHLVEETPEIPQLGEGVLMEVSDNGVDWYKRNIIARLISGYYIDSIFTIWPFARPIPQLPKYTHAELVEKLGHDFEIIK